MIDTMRTHRIPLYRRNNSTGYLNENNEWVEASFLPPITLVCNIQPLVQGRIRTQGDVINILPDGIRLDSAIMLRTTTQLRIRDHLTDSQGDEIEYKGKRYELFSEQDYSGYFLATDHYRYLCIRKDAL